MSSATCADCGLNEQEHIDLFASQSTDLIMMKQAIDMLPKEHGEVLKAIIIDWRTHSLPECSPLAIK